MSAAIRRGMRSKSSRVKYIDQIKAELSELLGASPDTLTDRQLREYMRTRLQLMSIQNPKESGAAAHAH